MTLAIINGVVAGLVIFLDTALTPNWQTFILLCVNVFVLGYSVRYSAKVRKLLRLSKYFHGLIKIITIALSKLVAETQRKNDEELYKRDKKDLRKYTDSNCCQL